MIFTEIIALSITSELQRLNVCYYIEENENPGIFNALKILYWVHYLKFRLFNFRIEKKTIENTCDQIFVDIKSHFNF